ncbi:jg6275 [Pararge aegeria aegeria]|uniref:Jg6275 protein n=1 Tax=Pararge aegeria aegeria TaxID=348720 RepID=A0A8S4SIW7_9NEOP|nr:jg6275 [Pararge aegeria aegeria]
MVYNIDMYSASHKKAVIAHWHNRALVGETTLKLSQGPLGRGSQLIECSGARWRRPLPADGYPSNLNAGITDSALCGTCMETDETPIHVMLQSNGVAEQRAAHLGSSATLHAALGDLGAC